MKGLEGHVDPDRILTLRYFLDVGYFLVWGIVLVTFLGAGFKNLVLGGALLSALFGIVAQGSLTNLFAGIVLALTHPFRVGETISFLTWQYPKLAASLTHPTQNPEHRGTVLAIGKIYTTIATEDGREMYVPNNIMLQAMVLREASSHGPVPCVFSVEVDISVDPDQLKDKMVQASSREPRLVGPVEVQVKSMAPRSMVLEFRSTWEGNHPQDFSKFIGTVLRQAALSSQG
jgi:small-conductance mechanosensitive channel